MFKPGDKIRLKSREELGSDYDRLVQFTWWTINEGKTLIVSKNESGLIAIEGQRVRFAQEWVTLANEAEVTAGTYKCTCDVQTLSTIGCQCGGV